MKWVKIISQIVVLAFYSFATFRFEEQLSWLAEELPPVFITLNFIVFAIGLNLLLTIMVLLYRRLKKVPPGEKDNVILGLGNIYYLIIAAVAFISLLAFWGIDIRTLLYSLSIVAAAIAIISKDYISEIISGIIITFSKELSLGDYVKIGDKKGKVMDISLTKIALLNQDDEMIFIPNNRVYTSEIINYTKREIKRVSIEFEMNLSDLDTIENLERNLISELTEFSSHIVPESYYLRVVDIRKDSLQLKFNYIFHLMDRDLERTIRKKTVRKIVNYVKTNSLKTTA